MATIPDASPLDSARSALEHHQWREAFDALSAADARRELAPEGLELLAQAAWWTGQLPVAIEARERAFAAAIKNDDMVSAVAAAINLGHNNLMRMATPVATAWLTRAERLLEGVEENPGHGWLAVVRSLRASLMGETDESLAQAIRAREIGKTFGDRDLEALGMSHQAAALMALGRLGEGLKLADEATISVVGGELAPAVAGGVSCNTIEACVGMGEFARAAQWIEAQDRWCRREGINGFPGMCRLYRSEIKSLRGAWLEAESEARVASEELLGFVPAAAAMAYHQVGEIRLRRGDLPAAEEALLRSHAAGRNPQPALALLRLAQGRLEEATADIQDALTGFGQGASATPPGSKPERLVMVPAQVEIALAAGDLETARAGAQELAALADELGTVIARAKAGSALGAVALAENDLSSATRHLQAATGFWTELDFPYEIARTRMLLADAHLAGGARDRAAVELRAARDAFERLGAMLDLRRADRALQALIDAGDVIPMGTSTTRAVRVFMFTDIVDSTRLAEGMGDAAWDKLIRIHDRTIRAAAAKQGGEEIKATGDGFFLAFTDADQAIEAAITMQRQLAQQAQDRDAEAPELAVRIGIHQAEANRVGLDYVGGGVNQASRIGDAAQGGEILVSAGTLEQVRRPVAEIGRRTVGLKGISAPVEVVAIAWN